MFDMFDIIQEGISHELSFEDYSKLKNQKN